MKFEYPGFCKVISVDLFCDEVIFVYDKEDEYIKKFINDVFEIDDEQLNELQELFDSSHKNNVAYYLTHPEIDVRLIRVKKASTYSDFLSVLSHEILHAVKDILESKRVPLNDDTEEVYTYLQQYLTKQITKEFFKDE